MKQDYTYRLNLLNFSVQEEQLLGESLLACLLSFDCLGDVKLVES
jgi:hypothetical protein